MAGSRWGLWVVAVAIVAIVTPSAGAQVPKRFMVGNITIVGNTRTSEAMIRERIDLFPGKTITDVDLRNAEKRLIETGLFVEDGLKGKATSVRLANNVPTGGFVDIIVEVQEKPRDPAVLAYACAATFGVILVVILVAIGIYWWSFRSPEPSL